MIVVLDASAVVELVLGTRTGIRIRARLADPRVTPHSPELVDVEVFGTLRHYERVGTISHHRAGEAFRNLVDLDLTRHGHEPLLKRVWLCRFNLTAYDAVYVTLAESLDAPLLTTDRRLAEVPRFPITVEMFDDADP